MNKKAKCKVCGYQVNYNGTHLPELWKHWKVHSPEELTNHGYKICEICGEIRCGSIGLMTHIRKTHKIDKYEYAKKFNIEGYVGRCEFCGDEFEIDIGRRCDHKRQRAILMTCKQKECMRKARSITYKNNTGYDNPGKNPVVKKKISKIVSSQESQNKEKRTCMERYGFEYPTQVPEFKEKIRQTCLKKYGVEWAMYNPIIKQKAIDGFARSGFRPDFNSSKREKEFKEFLTKLDIKFTVKKIYGSFVDICIELENSHKLIIMIDGEYWHNLDSCGRKIKSIYEVKNERDSNRLAKFMKDQLFNIDCEKDKSLTLIRIEEGNLKKFFKYGEPFGFYYACGDVGVIDDFMKKINKELVK